MRKLVRSFDAWVCRISKVFVFTNEADCILRLQIRGAPHVIPLGTNEIGKGQPVLMLHLWNERIPAMPPAGADLSWALVAYRKFLHSLRLVAWYIQDARSMTDIQAVGGISAVFLLFGSSGESGLMARLGFTVLPYQNPLGSFGEFWENFYSWWLMWTYNPASLRYRDFFRLEGTEIWMQIADFLARYG